MVAKLYRVLKQIVPNKPEFRRLIKLLKYVRLSDNKQIDALLDYALTIRRLTGYFGKLEVSFKAVTPEDNGGRYFSYRIYSPDVQAENLSYRIYSETEARGEKGNV